jgi:hypothetical protein
MRLSKNVRNSSANDEDPPAIGLSMAHKSDYTGPVFIHEFALQPSPADLHTLRIRMDMGRQFYNAMLGESHRRLKACRQDPRWREALTLGKAGEQAQANSLFNACRKAHGYSEYALVAQISSKNPASYRTNVFYEHLDSKCCQELAVRAFRACERFQKDRTHRQGKRRRIPFRRWNQFHTLSSIGMKIDPDARLLTWWRLRLPYRLAPADPDGLEAYVLDLMQDPENIREHGSRITRRIIRGKARYYLQITLKGQPFRKPRHPQGQGTVGIDIGPSTIAIVAPQGEDLLGEFRPLADGCQRDEREVRRLQRYLDRSRRATNPECYDAKGRCIARPHHKSKRYLLAERRLAEVERRLAARRKQAHNHLVHEILAKGDTIKLEALSYKGWQRGLFGKSIGRRAPGAFIARLQQQTEIAGGTFVEVPTYTTKLSQLCHQCGTYKKKGMSRGAQDMHQCDCGVGPIQRDIYSAFLVRFYNPDDTTFDAGAAQAAFAALQCSAIGIEGATGACAPKVTRHQALLDAPALSGSRKRASIADRALLQHGEAASASGKQKAMRTPRPFRDASVEADRD